MPCGSLIRRWGGARRAAGRDAAGAHGLVQRERDGRRAGVAVVGQVADHALGRHAQPLRRAVQDALRAVRPRGGRGAGNTAG